VLAACGTIAIITLIEHYSVLARLITPVEFRANTPRRKVVKYG